MRTLTTIGDLRSIRHLERSTRLYPIAGIGAFVAPALDAVDANPPGSALTAANKAMLAHFQAAGVPSEHHADPFVLAFQQAWNADPAPWRTQIATDGGFGTDTQAASASIVDYTGGGTVPPVNASQTPVAPAPTPTPVHPAVVAHSYDSPWLWVAVVGVAGGAAYAVAKWAKKRRARRPRRARSHVSIFT